MLQTHTHTHTHHNIRLDNKREPTCRLECEVARQDGWERSETDDTVFDVPSVLVNDAPGSRRGNSAKSTRADLIKAPAHVSG